MRPSSGQEDARCEGLQLKRGRLFHVQSDVALQGNDMTTNQSPQDIKELLAEADELIQSIESEILNEMEEEHRMQFEMQAQKFENIKVELQEVSHKKEAWEARISDEEIHEAVTDFVRAFKEYAKALY